MEGWVDLGYPAMHRPGVELAIFRSRVRRPNDYTAEPPVSWWSIYVRRSSASTAVLVSTRSVGRNCCVVWHFAGYGSWYHSCLNLPGFNGSLWHWGPWHPVAAPADVFRCQRCRSPVVLVIPAGMHGRSTYDAETPGQLSSCAYMCCAAGISRNTVHHVSYTADLVSVSKSHGLSPHIADDTRVCASCRPVSVDDFCRRSPSVSALFPAGWSRTATKPKFCGTSGLRLHCRPTQCKSTALLIVDRRSPHAIRVSILILAWWCGHMYNVWFQGACSCYVNSGRFVARCWLTRSRCWWLVYVLTSLDFGNSVLAGLPVYLVRRLQSVLNNNNNNNNNNNKTCRAPWRLKIQRRWCNYVTRTRL